MVKKKEELEFETDSKDESFAALEVETKKISTPKAEMEVTVISKGRLFLRDKFGNGHIAEITKELKHIKVGDKILI
jgi:hypothetical protein